MIRPIDSPGASEKSLLFCIATSRRQAEAIMHRLEAENFTDDRISVVFPDKGARIVPGLGAFIAAGPIIDALRAANDGDSAGIASGLIRLGMPAERAARCEDRLERGGFLLSAQAATAREAERALKILADLGAQEACLSCAPDLCESFGSR